MNAEADGQTTELEDISTSRYVIGITTAVVLNFALVGLGQVYNRDWLKAFGFAFTSFILWFLLLGWVVKPVAMLEAAYTRWKGRGSWSNTWMTVWGVIGVASWVLFLIAFLSMYGEVLWKTLPYL